MRRFALSAVVLLVVCCSSIALAADRWNEPQEFGFVPLMPTTPDSVAKPYVSWQGEMWFPGSTARLEEVSWTFDRSPIPDDKDIYGGQTAFEIVQIPGVTQTPFTLHGVQGIKFISTITDAVIPIRIVEKKNGKVARIWERKFLVHFNSSPRKGPFRPCALFTPVL